jgi:hypothetical protein
LIVDARWPIAEAEDKVVTRQGKYIDDLGYGVRISHAKQLESTAKRAKVFVCEGVKLICILHDALYQRFILTCLQNTEVKLDSCILFVAFEYPQWQQVVLKLMADGFHSAVMQDTWSCGHVVMWSCGRVVVWSCGRVVVWSCGQTCSES